MFVKSLYDKAATIHSQYRTEVYEIIITRQKGSCSDFAETVDKLNN